MGYRSGQTPPTQGALARPKADDEQTGGTWIASKARLAGDYVVFLYGHVAAAAPAPRTGQEVSGRHDAVYKCNSACCLISC